MESNRGDTDAFFWPSRVQKHRFAHFHSYAQMHRCTNKYKTPNMRLAGFSFIGEVGPQPRLAPCSTMPSAGYDMFSTLIFLTVLAVLFMILKY